MRHVRADVRVTGKVQGVWFRQSTKNMAERYEITGWCRNNSDGTVTAVFEGEKPAVEAVIEWCKSGPELARVDDLEVQWREATGDFKQFFIR
ncbi:acylphosphatase [Desulfuromusa kysingii]|uniref:Acylphosphatase n=1 Tax=Desulfuromusa kysingii TaxID=37625 RepID=A0A1H3ZIM8_9BACT|nr:acylphosphatase [Desulfuromusa kysingii]SEA23428.1 acylphosphatase [Desulfuromusa kysingii]